MTSLLDRQRERFLANPDDRQAFAVLEEELHFAGRWDALIEAYQSRIGSDALADLPAERAQLQLRMGQVHQDRCSEPDQALQCYRDALLWGVAPEARLLWYVTWISAALCVAGFALFSRGEGKFAKYV